MKIIGRQKEKSILNRCLESKDPEFVAVYGRRRVGKTYLVREFYHENFAFQLTGSSDQSMRAQLDFFDFSLRKYGGANQTPTKNWRDAFEKLTALLEHTKIREHGKRIVFFDEIAWLDTQKSGFLTALEHFWNTWGAAHPDFILIICGSSSSWIIKRIFKNRGGFHNRITKRIRLLPFNLAECEAYFLEKDIDYDRKSIADSYMVFGGIPYYLSLFQRGLSVSQNVDELCFAANAPLADEFEELYASLFKNAKKHIAVIRALATKRKGLLRDEIIESTGMESGGGLSDLMEELELSGFINRSADFSGTKGRALYQLVDPFSLFYLLFLDGQKRKDPRFWSNLRGSGTYRAWSGFSFELLCLLHVEEIKDTLGIAGVSTSLSSWRDPSPDSKKQIDLIIDRSDNVIDLCEIKYSANEFEIDKTYAQTLLSRSLAFASSSRTRKTIHLVLVTVVGLKNNRYSHTVQAVVTLDDLFGNHRRTCW
jgi:AAA+ ATPase superfamily predicted ATPase